MRKTDGSNLIKPSAVLIFIGASTLSICQSHASDWGYDGSTTPKDSTPAVFAGKHVVEPPPSKAPSKGSTKAAEANPFGRTRPTPQPAAAAPAAAKATTSKQAIAPAAASKSSNQPEQIDLHAANKAREAKETAVAKSLADKERKTVNDWLEIYALVAQEKKLSDDQRERYAKELAKCVNGPEKANFESVLQFWPLVEKSIKNNAEQKDNYRSLFKALFRLQQHSGSLNEHEANILSEILGPERIAVPGPPNLIKAKEGKHPCIALVLGGGGTRGAAHIGVLKIFEDNHVPIDLVVGTSMGAIVGGLHCAGLSADEIYERLNNKKFRKAFNTVPIPVRLVVAPLMLLPRLVGIHPYDGLYRGNKFAKYLTRSAPVTERQIEELNPPFVAVATNLLDGKTVAISHGNLAKRFKQAPQCPF